MLLPRLIVKLRAHYLNQLDANKNLCHTHDKVFQMDLGDIRKVIGTAVLPISELRGAIPIVIGVYDFPWWYAFLFGFIGNLLLVAFLSLLLNKIVPLLGRVGFFDRILRRYFTWMKHTSKYIERFGWLGLTLFVAIPSARYGDQDGFDTGGLTRYEI